jgi:hypothetical protein
MNDAFGGYYRPTAEQFKELWSSGTFFFDTSVLLNLYRYPQQARSDLLGVLRQMKDRIGVPFQSVLEFERNRLTVISDQSRRFREVEGVVNSTIGSLAGQLDSLQLKRRHSSIDPEAFLKAIHTAKDDFLKHLNQLERQQPKSYETDDIRDELRAIVGESVGPAPESQADLDRLFAEGTQRYARGTPPGFADAANKSDDFEYAGLIYKRAFGDLVLWEQVISTCKANAISHAVLVTDDDKEDWWWTVDAQGKKRIGPRPELSEEIRRRAGVSVFYMYNSEQLVRWSTEYLSVNVQNASIEQIREVRQVGRNRAAAVRDRVRDETAVMNWVSTVHEGLTATRETYGFPDIIVETQGGGRVGYEIIAATTGPFLQMKLKEILFRAYYELDNGRIPAA